MTTLVKIQKLTSKILTMSEIMKLALIVAMATNRVIGNQNKIPWHLSADLKRFKQLTLHSPIIMGRKTYESIGRALPQRTNIIISRNVQYTQPSCLVFNSIETALSYYENTKQTVFIIGGAGLYAKTLELADSLYITQIQKDFQGDVFFPEYDGLQWRETSCEEINDDASVNFSYRFLSFERL